ncbi:hypothetical protein B5P44_07100 [Mycobacterium sp. CBMA 213]|nr:hypothetical protein [Mycolicibacterium sp. CBMA 213]
MVVSFRLGGRRVPVSSMPVESDSGAAQPGKPRPPVAGGFAARASAASGAGLQMASAAGTGAARGLTAPTCCPITLGHR